MSRPPLWDGQVATQPLLCYLHHIPLQPDIPLQPGIQKQFLDGPHRNWRSKPAHSADHGSFRTILCIDVARPDPGSASIKTPHNRTSPLAASKRAGKPDKNFWITASFSTPITES